MKQIKVLVDFIRLAIAIKVAFFRNIITKLTGSTTFASPDIPLTELETLVNNLETTYLESRDGGHIAVSRMHDAEKAATVLLGIWRRM